jgi:UDP-galactopyranose mutase
MWTFDNLIVGAGFSGLVLAERLSTQLGQSCLIVEKRRHIGGNAHDEYDDAGVLIHKYGPHYFRTNSDRILEYLSQFTEWRPAHYQVLAFSDGRLWNFPINLNTFEQLIGRPSTSEEMEATLAKWRVPIENPRNSEEIILSQVGEELYHKFYKGYTLKHWNLHPRDLDAGVCGRIPIRTNRDDRYLREKYQQLPRHGYHKLFQRMLDACQNTRLLLNTNYHDVLPHVNYRKMIFTGPVDEFYGHRLGHLPYRSLRFEPQSYDTERLRAEGREKIAGKPGFYQPAVQVNYPNDHAFTRILEAKHITGQECPQTTIIREYPQSRGEPYYPVPCPDSARVYRQYRELAEAERDVYFVGRLATYRYYNMDQVVGAALKTFEKLKARHASETR